MNTPFRKKYNEEENIKLIQQCLNGSKSSLEKLVKIHQNYIYNLAWKMTADTDDAEDITQEVLIKVLTSLAKFKHNSSFRTWLYRITINHFLNMKKAKMENMVDSFEQYGNTLDSIPDVELSVEEQINMEDYIKDGQFRCMSAMLLCLTREQRITYVLGDIFGADHIVASELLDITPSNYRMRLSRARKDLYNFMNNKCGLVNKANPCRCRKKVTFAIQGGHIEVNDLKFNLKNEQTIKQTIVPKANAFGDYFNVKYSELQCEMPFRKSLNTDIFEKIINNELVKDVLNLK